MTNEFVNREVLALKRKESPVYWSNKLFCWVVTCFDDVITCLNNTQDLASNFYQWHLRTLPIDKRADFQELNNLPAHVLTEQDGIYHDHIKQFITKEFNLRVKAFGKNINTIITEHLQSLQGSFDFATEFANPISEKIMCGILGLDERNQKDIIDAATDLLIFLAFDGHVSEEESIRRAKCAKKSLAYMETLLEDEILQRLHNPKDDFISALLHKQRHYGDIGLSHSEIAYQVLTLMIAGFITTENFLSLAAHWLLKNESNYHDLVSNPKQVGRYVDVLFRIESPSTFVMRYARNSLQINDKLIKRGQFILLHLDSANHDEKYFESQCPFSKQPQKAHSVTFGDGSHICTGMPLARLVANKCFSLLISKFPKLQLSGDPVVLLDEFPVIRGIKNLPVVTNTS